MIFSISRRAVLVAALCLTACAPTPGTGPSATAAPSPSPLAATPAPVGTMVALSSQERDAFAQSYRLMVLAELDARLLLEFAQRVEGGRSSGSESTGSFLGLGAIFQAVGESLNAFAPPAALDRYWGSILTDAEATQDILTRWEDEAINASTVIAELQPVITDLNTTVADVGALLGTSYGFDPVALSAARDEVMGTIPVFFETPTPTAKP
jgi:hypothetical protein